MTTLSEARRRWRDQVQRLVGDAFYRNQNRAETFFRAKIDPVWRAALQWSDDEVSLVKELAITPTMLQLLHFFAHAYEGNRRKLNLRSPRPTIAVWPPYHRNGAITYFHAVPKDDLSRVLGRSRAAVDEAFSRFRGNRSDTTIKSFALVQPIAVPTGLMLDIKLTPQLCFGFMFEDYQIGKAFAEAQTIGQCETWDKQRGHCELALGYRPRLRLTQSDASTQTLEAANA